MRFSVDKTVDSLSNRSSNRSRVKENPFRNHVSKMCGTSVDSYRIALHEEHNVIFELRKMDGGW